MNRIEITGRVTANPELKYTPQGKSVTTFSVAVNRAGKNDESDFFRIQCWEKIAEFAVKYLRKGARVSVTGSHECRKWTDKGGGKRESWEVKPDAFGGIEPIDWPERGEDTAPADDGFYVSDDLAPNEPGF